MYQTSLFSEWFLSDFWVCSECFSRVCSSMMFYKCDKSVPYLQQNIHCFFQQNISLFFFNKTFHCFCSEGFIVGHNQSHRVSLMQARNGTTTIIGIAEDLTLSEIIFFNEMIMMSTMKILLMSRRSWRLKMLLKKFMKAEAMSISRMSTDYGDYGDYSGGRLAGPRDFPWYLFLSVMCHYRLSTYLFSSSPISQCHQTVALNCYNTINVPISFFGQFTPNIGHFDLGAWIVHKRKLNDCTPLILKY